MTKNLIASDDLPFPVASLAVVVLSPLLLGGPLLAHGVSRELRPRLTKNKWEEMNVKCGGAIKASVRASGEDYHSGQFDVGGRAARAPAAAAMASEERCDRSGHVSVVGDTSRRRLLRLTRNE